MKKSILFSALLIGLFLVVSCTRKKAKRISSDTLYCKWELTAIKFYPRDEIIIPTKDYWVEFGEEGRLSFKKEANTCHTKYETSGRDKLTINNQIACTKMCCDGDISDKLNYQDVTEYEIKGDQLILTTKDRKFEFTRANYGK